MCVCVSAPAAGASQTPPSRHACRALLCRCISIISISFTFAKYSAPSSRVSPSSAPASSRREGSSLKEQRAHSRSRSRDAKAVGPLSHSARAQSSRTSGGSARRLNSASHLPASASSLKRRGSGASFRERDSAIDGAALYIDLQLVSTGHPTSAPHASHRDRVRRSRSSADKPPQKQNKKSNDLTPVRSHRNTKPKTNRSTAANACRGSGRCLSTC